MRSNLHSSLQAKAATSLTLILGGVAVAQACSPRLLPFERQLYAGIVLLLGGYVYLVLLYGGVSLRKWLDLLLWLSFSSLFAIPVALQPMIYPIWLMGDAIVFVTPALLVLLGEAWPALYSRRNVLLYCGLAAIAAVVATQFQDTSRLGRFEPPKMILYGLAWYVLFRAERFHHRLAAATGVAALLLLSWHSDVRAAVVLWLITGCVLAFAPRSKALATFAFTGVMIVIIDLWMIFAPQLMESIPESRFDRYDFVGGRKMEILDAGDHFVEEANLVNYLLGFGFGATFKGQRLVGTIIDPSRRGGGGGAVSRLTKEGTIHIIHFGPTRIIFRYGMLGLFLWLILVTRICTDVAKLVTGLDKREPDLVFALLTIATLCYLLRWFLQPVENSIDFAYVLAGYIVVRRAVKSEVTGAARGQFAEAPRADVVRRSSVGQRVAKHVALDHVRGL